MIDMLVLAASIACVESGTANHPEGDPRAVGRAGEVSAHQITPAMWRQCAPKNYQPTSMLDSTAVCIRILTDERERMPAKLRDEPIWLAAVYTCGRTECRRVKWNWNRLPVAKRDYAIRVANIYAEKMGRKAK
jgi:hypothetical protein